MIRVHRTAVWLATAGLLLLSAAVGADEKKDQPGDAAAFAKPTKEHALLKQFEGEWDASVKTYFEPGKAPAQSKGSEVNRIVGGLWLVSDFKGEMLGQPFQGHSVQGYDPDKKKCIGVWVDSMEAKMHPIEGSFDSTGKVLTMVMEATGMDGKPTKFKLVTDIKDKDNHTFTMSVPGPDGKDIVAMVIDYKRKAK